MASEAKRKNETRANMFAQYETAAQTGPIDEIEIAPKAKAKRKPTKGEIERRKKLRNFW